MKERLPDEASLREQDTTKQRSAYRKLGKYAWYGLVLSSVAANYGLHGMTLDSQGVEHPYSPTKAGVAMANSYATLPAQLIGLDSCPPPPDQNVIDHYLTADYDWPDNVTSLAEHAANNNLTLPLYEDLSFFELKDLINNAQSLDEITTLISSRTEPMIGVTVSADGFDTFPESIPSISELRHLAKSLTQDIAMTPREVFEATNVRHITIRPLAQETYDDRTGEMSIGQFAKAGQLKEVGASVLLDINALSDSSVFQHELLGHGMHFAACGNFPSRTPFRPNANDTAITSFNPEDFLYDDERQQLYDAVYNEQLTVSGYGEQNVLEDVAETSKSLITGELQLNSELSGTPLGQKAGVILHRLDEQVPGLTDYYLQIAKY